MPELSIPRVAIAPSVREAARRFGDDPQLAYSTQVISLTDADLTSFVERLIADTRERSLRAEGHVPATHLWWAEGDDYIGRVHIRHRLTPFLRDVGGHIGYHIVQSYRRRGHATAMLAAALPVAAVIGLDCVLITCDSDNVGSRKVIETNGGLFHDQRGPKLRYWVPTG